MVGWPRPPRCPTWICHGFPLSEGPGSPTPCIGLSHGGTRLYVLDYAPSPSEIRVFDFSPPGPLTTMVELIVTEGDASANAFVVTDDGDVYYYQSYGGGRFWRQKFGDRGTYEELVGYEGYESAIGQGWNPYDGHVWDLRESARGTHELWRFNTLTDTFDENPLTLTISSLSRSTMPVFTSDGAIWVYVPDDLGNFWHRVDPDTLAVASMAGSTTNGPETDGGGFGYFDGVSYVGIPNSDNAIVLQAGPSIDYPDGGPGLTMAQDGSTTPYTCAPIDDPDLEYVTGSGDPVEFVTLAGPGRVATAPGHGLSAFIWPGVADWGSSYFPGGPDYDRPTEPGDLWVFRG